MAEKVFPERQRCKECRGKLDAIVLKGVYCSYRCAKHPIPPTDISRVPRHCKREVNGVWAHKTKYRYEGAVEQRLRDDPGTNIYLCDSCLFLHVGHSRVKPEDREKLRRTVRDMKTLGSVIQRRRLALDWDKKRLADDLGVRPIRITEIERGDANVDVNVMFALLNRLKVAVELIER